MKDLQFVVSCNAVQSFDGHACFIGTGITGACQHYAGGGLVTPFNTDVPKLAIDQRLEYLEEIRPQSYQNGLRFRVAETHVVLQHLRTSHGQHQPDKENSAERKSLQTGSLKSWLDNIAHDGFERFGVQD